jgi:hypothetical protein
MAEAMRARRRQGEDERDQLANVIIISRHGYTSARRPTTAVA